MVHWFAPLAVLPLCSWILAIPQIQAVTAADSSPTFSQSPPIKTRIQASWNAAPLVIQFLETVSIESHRSFFPLLSLLRESSSPDALEGSPLQPGISPQNVYERSLDLLERLDDQYKLDNASIDSLKLSLATREASPLIETHYQIYRQAVNLHSEQGEIPYEWYGECDESTVNDILPPSVCYRSLPLSELSLHSFDHIIPSIKNQSSATVIYYLDVHSLAFGETYDLLQKLHNQEVVQVVLRWKPSASQQAQRLVLSGYGVALDLKRVDYITIDDRDVSHDSSQSNTGEAKANVGNAATARSASEGDEFDQFDVIASDLVQVKPEQLRDLGIKATQFALRSASPLATLRELVQNFPKYAHKLVTSWEPLVRPDIFEELADIQTNYLEAGRNYAWLNGMQLSEKEFSPFSVLRLMRKERRIINDLMSLGITSQQAVNLIAHPAISASAGGSDPPARGMVSLADMGDFFDATDRRELQDGMYDGVPIQERDSVIAYWNDLEKDTRYRHWPPSLQSLLQPMYPGQAPQVGRNLINVILGLDFTKTASHELLADSVAPFIGRGLAIRFGSVPVLRKNDVGSFAEHLAQASWYLLERVGRVSAMTFHAQIAAAGQTDVSLPVARAAYDYAVKEYLQKKAQSQSHANDVDAIVSFDELPNGQNDRVSRKLQSTYRYNRRLGLASSDPGKAIGIFFVNGRAFDLDENFRSNLQSSMQMQMHHLMQQVYTRRLADSDDVSLYFYDQPNTYATRNPLIIPAEGSNPKFVNMEELQKVTGLSCGEEPEDGRAKISVWIFAESEAVPSMLDEARALLSASEDAQVCIVPVVTGQTPESLHLRGSLQWITDPAEQSLSQAATTLSQHQLSTARSAAQKLDYSAKSATIVVNGRVIEVVDLSDFSAEVFTALLAYERKSRFDPAMQAATEVFEADLSAAEPELIASSSMIAAITSIVGPAFSSSADDSPMGGKTTKRSRDYLGIPSHQTSFTLGDEKTASLQFAVILDPMLDTSQSWSAICETLAAMPSVSIRVYLNPDLQRADMPLKRFYRHIFPSNLEFDASGAVQQPNIAFEGVPSSILLTLAIDAPHAWQAFPKESVHDLDNIRLSDLKHARRERGVEALFELSNIIVEGHAREGKMGAPPRGLQLELSNGNTSTNTLVMANLGYHQLKANPGLWTYNIREGRSSEVFELESIEGTGSTIATDANAKHKVLVTDFEGVTIYPRFMRKTGMDSVDLLDEDEPQSPTYATAKAAKAVADLKNRVQSFFSKPGVRASAGQDLIKASADINIFTVASGLLYERMAMIMILSVLRHTRSTVKFWFINNFLSPSFKAFIPHLAATYGFQYELITYTWPAWLRGQKEKQRTIWGYKILFLDVLFPLELDRVIFVDSDQIVRTDLKQLVDLDLKGAPYAYTPMGDDREDMDNYRFWKGGYWAEHLRGRPYHISALYVIDLDRFRQIAAGDRLRQQYQALSADPNSLANLDQDLPNNMQAQLPIYTLDRSWLWCETWCSDESLKTAKTIDLCNNPKTHEPKLARAKRLIPEWTVYDKEIAALASKVAAANKQATSPDSVDNNSQQDRRESSDDSADAFTDEAGQLEQARMQQKEFVEEGTGADSPSDVKGDETPQSQGHIQGEL